MNVSYLEEINPLDIYNWQITFDNGNKINQRAQQSYPRQLRIDPQNPPPELGHPTNVELIPADPSFPEVKYNIPVGCSPVCHRLVIRHSNGQLSGLIFRIGMKASVSGVRTMKAVDIETRQVVDIVD